MNKIQSKINPWLTLEYIVGEKENKRFDCKSGRIKVSDIGPLICAFANAEGGTIVIGVSDKARKIEGINDIDGDKINSFISAPKDLCRPMPQYREEFLEVTNNEGKADRLLLLHIESSTDQMVRTTNDSVYLRISDRTREIKGDDLRNLEYSKSVRHFEDELNVDATVDDLDEELLERYRSSLEAEKIPYGQLLKARGFMKNQKGKLLLTNAAVLLFAKNVMQFYPNCRVRFVRYDGNTAGTGEGINIIKDYSMDLPLLRLIDRAKEFVGSQLREFMSLDKRTGKFDTVPEYPEFAWLEGIVNAVTHREYGLTGNYIKVSMYDDRLEIESPGKLPNVVTVENIRTTRYARNPKISRVLTDLGYVRELNEGVKRIYSDMEEFFLDEPEYHETDNSVRLTLRNNIVVRQIRRQDSVLRLVGEDVWAQLDELEQQILTYMGSFNMVSAAQLAAYTGRNKRTINLRLKNLEELGAVRSKGLANDPKRTYSIVRECDA